MPLFSRHPEPEPAPPVVEQQPKRHGLFGSKHEPAPQPQVVEEQPKRHGLFGSKHEPAPQPQVVEQQPKKRGLFGGRRSPSPSPSSSTRSSDSGGVHRRSTDASSHRGGLLHRSFGNGNSEMDPSIVAARERVMSAENAERQADRALIAARESVREAREHVRNLELEAEEEARRAKIKQYQAREVSKRGKQLGRKLP